MKFYTSAEQMGGNVLLRGFENGRRVQRRVPLKPYLFVPAKGNNGEFRSIYGDPLAKIEFGDHADAREFIQNHKDAHGFKIHGMTQFVYPFLNDEYPGEIKYDGTMVKTGTLDIETDSAGGFPDIKTANKQITAITMHVQGRLTTWGLKAFEPRGEYASVDYREFQTEKGLLNDFLAWWRQADLDILTGWNIEGFDVPYLVRRIARVLDDESAKKLSPWNTIRTKTVKNKFGEFDSFYIVGITILDYLSLYKKFTYSKQESYSLDYISTAELGEGKLDYKAQGYDSLADLYERNPQLYIEYNVDDVRRVVELDAKLGFIDLALAIAFDAKVQLVDVLGAVTLWDVIAHNYLLERKIAVPANVDGLVAMVPGAFVKEPKPGAYKNIVSFDLTSLYPHLIMQYNISPETFAEFYDLDPDSDVLPASRKFQQAIREALAKNLALAGNGAAFRREKEGFLPALMQKMFEDRKRAKDLMLAKKRELQTTEDPVKKAALKIEIGQLNNYQQAKKIALNSAYGALGNQYFRYYDSRLASAITGSGRVAIQFVADGLNDYLNKILKTTKRDFVIAMDTDSVYLNMELFVKTFTKEGASVSEVTDFLDKACEGPIQKEIDRLYRDLAERTNAYAQKMHMKREAISSRGFWVGKKRYALEVQDNEGVRYKEPDYKIMGLEAVRSDRPKVVREWLEQVYRLMLVEGEAAVQKYVAEKRDEFDSVDSSVIGIPIATSDLASKQLGASGLQQNYRAALNYNHLITARGLEERLQRIQPGDKVKMYILKLPNPAKADVIAAPTNLPQELGLDRYIDRTAMFEKSFLSAVQNAMEPLGWSAEQRATLDAFF